MKKLTELPNIGRTLAEKLIQADIRSECELRETGSENAILKLSTIANSGVCINMLYALEGAIQGIRWHDLNRERKKELLEFYRLLEKNLTKNIPD